MIKRTVIGLCAISLGVGFVSRADDLEHAMTARRVLAEHCFECHGPDAEARKADLRLDTQEGLAEIIEGSSLDRSELWRRVTSADPDERMPPEDANNPLSAEELDVLKTWIENGAQWSAHWAFEAPKRAEVPRVADSSWVRNPIDAFVLSKLEDANLKPSEPADRRTWIRRVYLDLIGLTPPVDAVESFVTDNSANAHQKIIRRLLDSEHYGERWGRVWLDAARYADSDGYEKDKPRSVWFYRDWVLNALNHDMPYDEFIIQQIAGDLLPNAGQSERVATGFLRNSMINEEGGVDPEQFRMEAMFDRMDAIGKGVLGLTINCAQCHDHKYDPLSQEEYYGMFAYINNSNEAQRTVYTETEHRQRDSVMEAMDRILSEFQTENPNWRSEFNPWKTELTEREPIEWRPVALRFDDSSIGGQKFLAQPDGSYLAQSYAPTKFRPKMSFETELDRVSAIRLELLTDPNLPRMGHGRSVEGTAALTEFEIEVVPGDGSKKPARIQIANAVADVNPPRRELKPMYRNRDAEADKRVTGPIDYAIDGDDQTAWTTDIGYGRNRQPRAAVFTFEEPVELDGPTTFNVYLSQKHGGWNSDDNQTFNIGRFRLSVTGANRPAESFVPPSVERLLEDEKDANDALLRRWIETNPKWSAYAAAMESAWAQHPKGTTQLTLDERDNRRPTFLLTRGDFLKPAHRVDPGVPSFLHPLQSNPEEPARLQFARWLADRNSPTTARAIVNRVWQSFFGIGLVETSDDLGVQSAEPSHPDLLDWLAVEFMDSDWSLKHLCALIADSATYRQSSHLSEELQKSDPYNRLLARGPRFRVDAEIVRDIALSASGALNPKIGGPSVYPPAPDFLFQPPASYGPKVWDEDQGQDRYRRALYTFRFRSVPYPMLETFDAPPGAVSCVRRPRSNTPLQALVMLNEPMMMELAQEFAETILREASASDEARIDHAMRRALSRPPTNEETLILKRLLSTTEKRLSNGELNASEITGGVDNPDLAQWTLIARAILSLDETITKE